MPRSLHTHVHVESRGAESSCPSDRKPFSVEEGCPSRQRSPPLHARASAAAARAPPNCAGRAPETHCAGAVRARTQRAVRAAMLQGANRGQGLSGERVAAKATKFGSQEGLCATEWRKTGVGKLGISRTIDRAHVERMVHARSKRGLFRSYLIRMRRVPRRCVARSARRSLASESRMSTHTATCHTYGSSPFGVWGSASTSAEKTLRMGKGRQRPAQPCP